MRLSEFQVKTIKNSIQKHFGEKAEVWLFGSRLHDEKRGGDIDLLVRSDLSGTEAMRQKLQALSAMQMAMGDQKIDLVLAPRLESPNLPLVVSQALQTGVPL